MKFMVNYYKQCLTKFSYWSLWFLFNQYLMGYELEFPIEEMDIPNFRFSSVEIWGDEDDFFLNFMHERFKFLSTFETNK